MNFYTNIHSYKGKLLLRGYDKGTRMQRKIDYKPYLFINSKTGNSDYHTLQGKPVDRIDFASISEAREFVQRYQDVQGITFHGLTQFQYVYLQDEYPEDVVEYDRDLIRVLNIDIEVAADEGFPSIELADKPITAITMKHKDKYWVFGCGEYTVKDDNVKYVKCADEATLIMKFLDVWRQIDPDIVTGWNVEFFDIPYIVNRIRNVCGEGFAKKISPWEILNERTITIAGREHQVYDPIGLNVLDYMQLYRKFTFVMQESYRLDHIATVELGEKKLDYSEFDSLLELYKKDYEKFIDYNIKDVELVERLEDKLKLIDQVLAIAYDGKVNFQDTFTSVRMWDIIIHNYLLSQKVVVPQLKLKDKERQAEGAYVKDPKVGMHKWVVSFDLNSLYPHLIMQYNISPETYVRNCGYHLLIEDIVNGKLNDNNIRKQLDDENLTIAATGGMFTKDYQGFLPKLMQKMYDDRVTWKNEMLSAKKEYEKNPSYEVTKKISQCHNMQLAKKVQLNSAYGALGNQYFRWFDLKYAEAITKSGQLSIRWMEKKINEYLNRLFKTEGEDYVLACDTDSMYITLDKLVNQVFEKGSDGSESESKLQTERVVSFLDRVCTEKLEPYIDKCYKELAAYVNAYDQKMVMKRENIADKAIWTAKKRYIMNVHDSEGVRYGDPKLKIMGIEAVRSSTPSSCRTKIKEAIVVIMNQSEEEVIDFINNFREEFSQLPFEDVAFPRGCKGLTKYKDAASLYRKGTPIHVRGALVYNNLLKEHKLENRYQPVQEGDKVKFCYLKLPNPVRENVLSISNTLPRRFGLEKYIDYDTQFDKAFLEPIRTIMDAIGWRVEKQASLEDFWS